MRPSASANTRWSQFSKQEKPVDVENRLEADRITGSGMNTPEIVDGATQVPLSRSLGRARGHSAVLAMADEAMLPSSSSRARRSSISKEEGDMLDPDTSRQLDASYPANGRQARPVRRESVMSARSAYTVRGNGKQKKADSEWTPSQEGAN